MYLPSGLYSGPSSRPFASVRRTSGPPPAGIRYTSKLPLRSPQNTMYFLSGDQPCMYDGPVGVICLPSPPPIGTVNPTEAPFSPLPLLKASVLPSKDITWSLLFFEAAPVLISFGVPVDRSKLYSLPSGLYINDLPSFVQLGACNEAGIW